VLLVCRPGGHPDSIVAFGFLATVHTVEHVVWHDLPSDLG